MVTMSPSPPTATAMSAAGLKVNDLRHLLKIEIEASNELQRKIDQFRYELLGGKRPPERNISLMEEANKDMTKELVKRIEQIEGQIDLTSTDREMLQALSARLAVCDEQAMRLVELRDLEREEGRRREASVPSAVPQAVRAKSIEARDEQRYRGPPLPIQPVGMARARTFETRDERSPRSPPAPVQPPVGLIRPTPVELLPLGGRPRRPETSPPAKVTEHLRPSTEKDARSTSPGPILKKVDSKTVSPSPSSRERRRDSLYLYRPTSQSSRSSSTVVGTPPLPSKTPPTPKISEERGRYEEPVEEMPYRRPSISQARRPSPKVHDNERALPSIPQARRPSPVERVLPNDLPLEMQQRRPSLAPPSPMFRTTPRSSADSLSPPMRSHSDHHLPQLGNEALPPRRTSSYRPSSYRQPSDEKLPQSKQKEKEAVEDKAAWPLLYRILDVDPRTDPAVFDQVAKMALARLSLKHDPLRHPTDPEAPVRWAAVVQAYDTLIDPMSRRAYDAHRPEASNSDHFDFSKLSVGPR